MCAGVVVVLENSIGPGSMQLPQQKLDTKGDTMNRVKATLQQVKGFQDVGASAFLLLLLCGDLAFVGLHIVSHLIPMPNEDLFSLAVDLGYSEFYQYVKELWIALLFVAVAVRSGEFRYLTWTALFTYLLLDDSLSIHETLGIWIMRGVDFEIFGLYASDLGDVIISAIIGGILFLAIGLAYVRGSFNFRRATRDLFLLMGIMVFFGVVVDVAHAVSRAWYWPYIVLAIVEDGGELVAMSLILWYAYLLFLRKGNVSVSLWHLVLALFTGRTTPAVTVASDV